MSTMTGGDLNLVKPELTDDHKVTIGTDLPANFQAIDDAFTARRLSNKNILHNWDFRNPVNQRGASSYTGGTYGIDRWRNGGANFTIDLLLSEALRITATASYATRAVTLWQIMENANLYVGTTLTLSFDISAYTGSWGFRARFASGGIYLNQAMVDITASGITSVTFTVPATTDAINIEFQTVNVAVNDYISLKAAKLEVGSVSTLANDPPAEFGEQLALCQRQLVSIEASSSSALNANVGQGLALSTTLVRILLPFPNNMRSGINGTVAITVSEWQLIGATTPTISSVAIMPSSSNMLSLDFTVTGATSGSPYILRNSVAGAKILYSKEL